jgi:hypothetical protein
VVDEIPETSEDDRNASSASVGFRRLLRGLLEEAQEYTRRKPMEGLLLALIAGMVPSNLIRSGR